MKLSSLVSRFDLHTGEINDILHNLFSYKKSVYENQPDFIQNDCDRKWRRCSCKWNHLSVTVALQCLTVSSEFQVESGVKSRLYKDWILFIVFSLLLKQSLQKLMKVLLSNLVDTVVVLSSGKPSCLTLSSMISWWVTLTAAAGEIGCCLHSNTAQVKKKSTLLCFFSIY